MGTKAVQAPSAPKSGKGSPKTKAVKAPAAEVAEAERNAAKEKAAPPANPNEMPFPVRRDFYPAGLRDEMHAEAKVFDFTVDGEAAWCCLEQSAIACDKLTENQKAVCATRESRGRLSDATRRA